MRTLWLDTEPKRNQPKVSLVLTSLQVAEIHQVLPAPDFRPDRYDPTAAFLGADCIFRLKGKPAGLILSDLAAVKNISCDVDRAAIGF
jgi:hypothetical protein